MNTLDCHNGITRIVADHNHIGRCHARHKNVARHYKVHTERSKVHVAVAVWQS